MKKIVRISLAILITIVAVFTIAPLKSKAAPNITSSIYSDNLNNGWQNWSWGSSVTVQDSAYVRSGSFSISCAYTGAWGGLSLGHSGFNTTGYDNIVFYINGGANSGQALSINVVDAGGNFLPGVDLNTYITGGSVAANAWRLVTVPLTVLGGANATITGVVIQDAIGSTQPRFYIDDMQFATVANATQTSTRTPTRTITPTVTGTPPTATRTPTSLPTATPASGLPPIPVGLPSYFGFGMFNDTLSNLPGGVRLDFRYQYLAGGTNTGGGWQTWQSNGLYAHDYVAETRAAGYIPGFVYYNILQNYPIGNDEWANLHDVGSMRSYYDDWKQLMIQSAGQGSVVINIEPDLDGVLMQHSSNVDDNAAHQSAYVAQSGMPELAGMPNTVQGFYQALVHLRDLYAPNVLLGTDLSLWGASNDLTLALRDNPNYDWNTHATRTANYHASFGPGFQLNFFSPLDRDAGFYVASQGSNRWWDDNNVRQPTFNTMGAWLERIMEVTHLRTLMWQVPNGNRVYRSENNTDGHYQDNRAEYFLNPVSGRAHVAQWANSGVIGLMWGAGAGGQTHYFDSNGDGVTNPAAIDGNPAHLINSLVSAFADDDGGYLRLQIASYYAVGALPLPGGGVSNTPTSVSTNTRTVAPTNTRTRTVTPVTTNTPTRTATNTSMPINTATNTPTPPQSGCEAVVWTNSANVTITGNTIQKTGGAPSTWDAGAVSTRAIQSGDGSVQATVDAINTYRMFGLGNSDTTAHFSDIDFAAYLAGNTLMVYERGVYKGSFGSLAVGDIIRVAIESGVVKYYRNSTLVYTSATSPTYPLALDTSINSSGGRIVNAYICGGNIARP